MNCFVHGRTAAVGLCTSCQKAVCHECVARDTPGLFCRTCAARGALSYPWYGYGYGYSFEYKSSMTIAGWPLIHVCGGIDPVTMRPRIAKGVIAIGNIAFGVLAIGGLACGLLTLGGASLGLLLAIGGAALGFGLSLGGFAAGSIAIGGAAVGFMYAVGAVAIGPAVIDTMKCDDAVREFVVRWLGAITLPPRCQ